MYMHMCIIIIRVNKNIIAKYLDIFSDNSSLKGIAKTNLKRNYLPPRFGHNTDLFSCGHTDEDRLNWHRPSVGIVFFARDARPRGGRGGRSDVVRLPTRLFRSIFFFPRYFYIQPRNTTSAVAADRPVLL